MKTGSLVMAVVLLVGGLAAVLPATGAPGQVNTLAGEVQVSTVQKPIWWSMPSGWYNSAPDPLLEETDEEPVWVLVRPPPGPYTVTLTATGPVVGSMHVYEVYPTFDFVTPPCPQPHISRLYWQVDGGESFFSYANRLLRITTQEHQFAVPANPNAQEGTVSGSASIEIVPTSSSDWYIFAFDGTAGTDALGGTHTAVDASLKYSISSLDGDDLFTYSMVTPGSSVPGFDLSTWSGNSGQCIDEGPPVPPGIPPEDVPQTGAPPELPGLGPTTLPLDRLFGTSL